MEEGRNYRGRVEGGREVLGKGRRKYRERVEKGREVQE